METPGGEPQAFLPQRTVLRQPVQATAVVRAVEAPVEAGPAQLRTVPLHGLGHRHCMVHIRALPYHPVMQDEAMPILRDANRNDRPDRRSGPALRDPPDMGPEDREHLLLLRNLLALQDRCGRMSCRCSRRMLGGTGFVQCVGPEGPDPALPARPHARGPPLRSTGTGPLGAGKDPVSRPSQAIIILLLADGVDRIRSGLGASAVQQVDLH